MAPRDEMMESKYQPETCGPLQHHYLDHHRQAAMLLSLPTKTEVSFSQLEFSRERLECLECQVLFVYLVKNMCSQLNKVNIP